MGFDPEALIVRNGKSVPLGDILWSGIRAFKAGRYADALPDLELGAENRSVDAARLLARMYYAGHGVEKNDAMYMHWLARAAELGDLASRSKLKRLVRKGCIPESLQNDERIARWIKR